MSEVLIRPADRIFVAGHRGMAGGAICRALGRAGYGALLTAPSSELDLRDAAAVENWFAEHRPTVVVLAAAKVGGIHANATYPADFLLDNLKIETQVIENAWRHGARRLLFLRTQRTIVRYRGCALTNRAKQRGFWLLNSGM